MLTVPYLEEKKGSAGGLLDKIKGLKMEEEQIQNMREMEKR